METSEERNKRFAELRENIAQELAIKYKNITFHRHKYGIEIYHYYPHFHDQIYIYRLTKSINTTIPNLDTCFLTEEDAREAITKYIPQAKKKYKECLIAFKNLLQKMDFDVSHHIYGDTHGISDYPIISFKLGNFDFTFKIRD